MRSFAGALGELLRVRELRERGPEVDRLLERVERVGKIALVPEDVRELVPGVAVHLVVGRRLRDDLLVRLLRRLPLRRVALRLVEEELSEREVRVRDVLRVRRLRDEVEVHAARVGRVARLLVLVREVVVDLVEPRVRRGRVLRERGRRLTGVVVDENRVVADGRLARLLHRRLARVRDRLLFLGFARVALLGGVTRHLGDRLLAEGRVLELDVVLCETAEELRSVGRRVVGRMEERLELLDLRDEQREGALLERALAGVAEAGEHRHVGGTDADLLVALLDVFHLRVERHRGRLAVGHGLDRRTLGADVEGLLGAVGDARRT